jgi:hypothetical protein
VVVVGTTVVAGDGGVGHVGAPPSHRPEFGGSGHVKRLVGLDMACREQQMGPPQSECVEYAANRNAGTGPVIWLFCS